MIIRHKERELNQDPLEKGSQYFYLRSLHRNQVWCTIDVNQALGRLWYRMTTSSLSWVIKQDAL